MTTVHLVDGTFELFRAFFGSPKATAPDGVEVGATRGFLRSMRRLTDEGATHVAVAFDTVIESFRNDLFAGYKTGAGIEPALWGQAPLVEAASRAYGFTTWSMIEFEADDALATAAVRLAADPRVERVVICTPDKDLGQVVGGKVVQLDRIRGTLRDEAGVREKFGVEPRSIPDWLALVGDTADGIPGIPRWGEKGASAVLARYGHLEQIPRSAASWDVDVRGAKALSENLEARRADALLYRVLATLRTDVPIDVDLDALRWRGPDGDALEALCDRLGDGRFLDR
jgi:5'-3' exonuclease